MAVVVAERVTEDLPAPTFGDPAELLDVDVDELAWPGSLIAADHPTGWPVHPREAVQSEPDEHTVDGGRRDAQAIADASRAELERRSQLGDLGLEQRRGAMRAAARPA